MHEFSSFEIQFDQTDDDKYIRAVRFNLIRRNGDIKAGAFKSNRGGVSVTRTNNVLLNRALAYMKSHFEGEQVAFPVTVCSENDIYEKHSPSPGHNLNHWELYGDKNLNALSDEQIDALIDASVFM